jgi:hypothetical protein
VVLRKVFPLRKPVEDVEEERQRERESPRQSELAEEEEEEEDGNYIVYQTQKIYNPIYVHLYVRICTYIIHSFIAKTAIPA